MAITPKRVGTRAPDPKDSPWGGLRSRFLASLDPAEQMRIFDLSARTSQTLHRWAARYPLIRRVRVWPLSLSVAAGAPFTSVEALISTARLSLWVFTLDDLFDEERVPQGELMKRADRYRALAHNTMACPSGDSLAAALCELRDDLATYRLFEPLGAEWANSLCGTIDGMLAEYHWRLAYRKGADDNATLPCYGEYVATGRYSIGGPPHIWAALITSDDPSTPQHLDHLRAMEKLASTCIRLANDLQSYQKEIKEGKINALVILSRELRAQGVAEEDAYRQAEARVRADIEDGLEQLTRLRDSAVTQTGRPEAAIDNIARFVCDFYTHHDYHTFLAQAA
jgi:Terpene synthase family 2, C-terminal metal binding